MRGRNVRSVLPVPQGQVVDRGHRAHRLAPACMGSEGEQDVDEAPGKLAEEPGVARGRPRRAAAAAASDKRELRAQAKRNRAKIKVSMCCRLH